MRPENEAEAKSRPKTIRLRSKTATEAEDSVV